MKTKRTLDQIRTDGLAALRERLGVAGMVRFLQQFEHGSGDYASERGELLKGLTMAQLRRRVGKAKPPQRKARSGG